ncbi:MAG TPA: ATP-binding cassette domain-containing protein [Micromonosporaceae bacterium]|nr:ATP-binding cassette domain-containing protein [Micromonosporaceae bacterium]
MSYAIRAEGLVKRFGATTALAGVDLAVPAGRVFGLLGPNGAGKTTAVRVLATLLRPDQGWATVGGYDVVRQTHQVRQLIGLAGQYASVDENLTGAENLLLIGRLLGLSKVEARARGRRLLAEFRMEEAADRAAKTYSGGMRRRLGLAVSLVGRPQILFLDEPTTGLDPRSRNELWDLVRGLVREGVTVLLTTQYLDEADQLADEIAVVDQGRVIAQGTVAELKAKIGGKSLGIRPADPAQLPSVAAMVRELASQEPKVGQDSVTVPVIEPGVLPAVVRWLDETGVEVAELALPSSSLDEVFFALATRRVDSADGAGRGASPGGRTERERIRA